MEWVLKIDTLNIYVREEFNQAFTRNGKHMLSLMSGKC